MGPGLRVEGSALGGLRVSEVGFSTKPSGFGFRVYHVRFRVLALGADEEAEARLFPLGMSFCLGRLSLDD